MKKMSKGKKIAIIIISVILSIAILLPIGAYAFVIFVVPRTMDGEEIKAEYIDNPEMSVSWQEYDKQNLMLSGKTVTYTEDGFEITLPESFVVNEEGTKDGFHSYWIKKGENSSASVIISDPVFTDEDKNDPEHEQEWKVYETMHFGYKLLFGHAAKKVYGIELGTEYNYKLLINSMDIDTFDVRNHNQKFLFAILGMEKSMSGMGILNKNNAIYNIETDTYKGFIYNRSKVAESEEDESYDMYSMDAYSFDDLNSPYIIFIRDYDNALTEDDIFAIFNSFKVK